MLLSKFAMVAMLMWMAFLTLYLTQSYAAKGGPFYYIANLPGGENPIQPRFRLGYRKMREHARVWEVHNDRTGQPYLIKYLSYGRETGRKYFYRDRGGKLRYEGLPGRDGGIELRQISPP